MEQAKSILPRLFQQDQAPFLDELDLIRGYWPETVGPLLAERSTPVGVRSATLVVEVRDPPYRELLAPMRDQIVACLRAELRNTSVRTIEFRLADDRENVGSAARHEDHAGRSA